MIVESSKKPCNWIPACCRSFSINLSMEKIKTMISVSFVGGIIGASGGIIGVVLTIPAPESLEEQDKVILQGMGTGAGIGVVLGIIVYCLYGAKIVECLIKICPKKCCRTINDGRLQAPIIENL